jgi:hypothetical protein
MTYLPHLRSPNFLLSREGLSHGRAREEVQAYLRASLALVESSRYTELTSC